jgi:hypothetical protein
MAPEWSYYGAESRNAEGKDWEIHRLGQIKIETSLHQKRSGKENHNTINKQLVFWISTNQLENRTWLVNGQETWKGTLYKYLERPW